MKNSDYKKNFIKTKVTAVIFLLLITSSIPIINGKNIENNIKYENSKEKSIEISKNPDGIDIEYAYSIIQNLSYIIFTEYNESAGEIAKGRAFGTKGEHKAAQILYENMTNLGLITTKEKINNTEHFPELTYGYDILDRKFTLKNEDYNETIECFISAIELSPPLVHEKIYNLSFKDLKIKKYPNTVFELIKTIIDDKKDEEYLFLAEKLNDGLNRDPNISLSFDLWLLRKIFNPISLPSVFYTYLRRDIRISFLEKRFHNCKGIIISQFEKDTFDTAVTPSGKKQPVIIVNKTIGDKVLKDINNFTVDFYIKEMYNKSIESYNVIGLLEGTDKNKTVVVDCLYDSVWCQGTGDAAIGMGIVMGVAKYFKDHNIHPKCNIKFIGFGGEEAGCRGVKFYTDVHNDENVTHVIDMNQVCSLQDYPRLTLNVIFNKFTFMNEIWPIIKESNYTKRVGNTDIAKRCWPLGAPSDDNHFTWSRKDKKFNIKTVCFLEDFPWIWHHRDGLKHKAGDVFDHVDWNEVEVLGEIVINIVKHLTV